MRESLSGMQDDCHLLNLHEIGRQLLFLISLRRSGVGEVVDRPQILRVQPPVILALDAVVSLQQSLPAQQWKGEPFCHSCLRLIEPVPTGLPHRPEVFGCQFYECSIFELIVGRQREGLQDGLEILFGQEGGVG
jgi:hypothetical protein